MRFFVVAIHTNLGIENELTWILFQTIARIAVPYFLVVAGWFFYRNILINQRVIFKYIMNLLRAYVIAALPFAVVFIIKNNKSETFFENYWWRYFGREWQRICGIFQQQYLRW